MNTKKVLYTVPAELDVPLGAYLVGFVVQLSFGFAAVASSLYIAAVAAKTFVATSVPRSLLQQLCSYLLQQL